jgi:hypothetical protein
MSNKIDQAKSTATAARARMSGTIATVKQRISPKAISQDMLNKARTKAEDVVGVAKSRPALTLGIVTAGALVLFRKPVMGAIKRLTKEK